MKKSWMLFLLVMMAVLLNADNLVLSPNIDAIQEEFGIGDKDIGNISALFVVVGALVSLLWGYFGDKGSRKLLMVLAIIIGEIPCALTAFATTYSQFFWLRVFTGIGVGASFPILFSLVADLFGERERGKATAYVSAAIGIGSVLGMLVGGYGGAAWDWRLPFLLVAAPNFLVALLFHFTVREPRRGMSEEGFRELVDQGVIYPRTIKLSDYRRLFTVRTNLLLFIQGIAGCIPWGAIPLFLVVYLTRVRGFDLNMATTVFLMFGLGNIVGILLGGVIGGALYRKSPALVPLFSGLTTVVGTLLAVLVFQATWVQGFWAIIILGFLAAMTASLTGPNAKMMLMNVNVPENRGAIFSIFNMADSVGNGLGRFVGGWLAQFLTVGPAMTISSLFWLPCGIILLVLTRLFIPDVETLRRDMRALASELGSKSRVAPVGPAPPGVAPPGV